MQNATNTRITIKERIIDFTQLGEVNLGFAQK